MYVYLSLRFYFQTVRGAFEKQNIRILSRTTALLTTAVLKPAFTMFSITTELFEYAFLAMGVYYLIAALVKQDLQDQNEPPIEETAEEEKPIVQILDIENMTPSEKVTAMTSRLEKLEKLLLSEQQLNNVHECLVNAQQLKNTTDNLYLTEANILGDAILWLEKPLRIRGGFDSKSERSRHDNEDMHLQIKNLMKTFSGVMNPVQVLLPDEKDESTEPQYSLIEDENYENDLNDDKKPGLKELMTPENLLKLSDWVWLRVNHWSPLLIRRASDIAQVWFVVFMTVRTAVLSPKRLEDTTDVMHKLSMKYLVLETVIDESSDETTVILKLFPPEETPVKEPGGFYGFFNKLLARVKSILKH